MVFESENSADDDQFFSQKAISATIEESTQSKNDRQDALTTEIEALMAEPPQGYNTTDIQNQINVINDKSRHINNARNQAQAEQQALVLQGTAELQYLAVVDERRLEAIRESDPDIYEAVYWVQRNQDLFEEEVFSPIFLEINVKEERFTDVIEAVAGQTLLKMFVCQTLEDYRLFVNEVIDSQRLRVNVTWCKDRVLEDFTPPTPLQELQQNYGVECYLLDQVEGPDPVLTILCSEANFHAVPYASGEIDFQKCYSKR